MHYMITKGTEFLTHTITKRGSQSIKIIESVTNKTWPELINSGYKVRRISITIIRNYE